MTKYNTLKKLIVDRVPRLKELSMGCYVYNPISHDKKVISVGINRTPKNSKNEKIFPGQYQIILLDTCGSGMSSEYGDDPEQAMADRGYTILGHDPSPYDLLEALGDGYALYSDGEICFHDLNIHCYVTPNLIDLPEETMDTLIVLLTK